MNATLFNFLLGAVPAFVFLWITGDGVLTTILAVAILTIVKNFFDKVFGDAEGVNKSDVCLVALGGFVVLVGYALGFVLSGLITP